MQIEKMERSVETAKWQELMYWHLAGDGVPSSFHCLSLKLAEAYSVNAEARSPLPLPQLAYRLKDSFFNHIVLLTDNVLAASVVISSALKASSHPQKLVFHVVTDKKSYTSMHSWFALTTVHPSAVVEIKGLHHYDWPRELNAAVKEMLEIHLQIRNHRRRKMMEELEFVTEHDHKTDVLSASSVSLLNHLRIYLPQVITI